MKVLEDVATLFLRGFDVVRTIGRLEAFGQLWAEGALGCLIIFLFLDFSIQFLLLLVSAEQEKIFDLDFAIAILG